MFSAHSPDKRKGIGIHPYASHVKDVLKRALTYVDNICRYSAIDGENLSSIVRKSALFHDLGKLDKENQLVLLGEKTAKTLPFNHVDAGASHLWGNENYSLAAAVIQAHHIGYCDFLEEEKSDDNMFRDPKIMEHTNKTLDELLSIHNTLVIEKNILGGEKINGNHAVFLRIALSCLVDADHTDTAIHYQKHSEPPPYLPLRAAERLNILDNHIESLKKPNDERSELRHEMFHACRNSEENTQIISCDSPVGSGKTTAIMAYLLKQAHEKKLRRIFIILPFINIIRQSVKIYKDILTLEGENPDDIVCELHHRADFQDKESRYLSSLWRAPIIVTTAVAFFETLASNSPTTLRRLHELPGSAIFVDESHGALPVKLLPLAWQWINTYSKEWNCYWVLASGSLNKFWEINEINLGKTYEIPELVNTNLKKRLFEYEKNRIKYCYDSFPKNLDDLSNWIINFPGPRLLIVNTVQNAAIIADYFEKKFGRDKVEHLSTALTPMDREATIKNINNRLNNTSDNNWTLVATSCIEAGVDLSFRTGFRELSSLLSLLQTAGRVNRSGFYHDSEIWTFKLKESDCFNFNPELQTSRNILQKFFENRKEIVPELSTESIYQEIQEKGISKISKELLDCENANKFPSVEILFKVINTKTVLVIVNEEIANNIKNYKHVSWQEIQKHSVRIYGYNIDRFEIDEIIPGIYKWNFKYDSFLGIMAGALAVVKAEKGQSIIA